MTIRTVEASREEAGATYDPKIVPGRRVAFDYLRAFTIALVLCHHAVIAYTTSVAINLDNPIETASPVVNAQRWIGFDVMVVYNETFFMPLLYFISGLFVWQSLGRKGAGKFLGDRLKRLGLPFIIGVAVLIPLAYYPAQLQIEGITGAEVSYRQFWLGMIRSGFQTAGPLWFLWLLLVFNGLVAFMYHTASAPQGWIRGRLMIILGHPLAFFGALLAISMAVYQPGTVIFGPLRWIGRGPFNAQAARILVYLVYFLAGTAIGAYGIDRSIFGSDGAIARGWWRWWAVGLIAFMVFIFMMVAWDRDRTLFSEMVFMACCGATVLGVTGFFIRFARRRVGVFDSLSANAYGIYVVHYVFVTWLQYWLLESLLSPVVKGGVVFTGTLILSWGTVAALRRIPAVARVL